MYFPYLRGKQFELIALRELVPLPLDGGKMFPIIEPVKKGLKSLQTAVKILTPIGVKIQLIVNPQVGELVGKTSEIVDFITENYLVGYDNIIPTFLIHSDSDFTLLQQVAVDNGYDQTGYSLVHLAPIRAGDALAAFTKGTACRNNIIHNNHIFSLRRKFDISTVGILGDYFRKQRTNKDYANDVDESFSSDCFFYIAEGFVGFADYQTIGQDWVEGGMLPKAVVIHLTYRDPGQDELRVHHFVSDTNDDNSDIAGKFYEAVTKLVNFAHLMNLDTLAIRSFRDLHARQAFPGLGSIKKLSIMHHIETIQGLI